MRKLVGGVIILALAASPVSAAKPEPVQLAPSSPWNVNYADDYCRLARSFGTGDATTIIFFDSFGASQGFKLIITGKQFGPVADRGEAEVRFGPAEKTQKVEYLAGNMGKDRPALIFQRFLRVAAPELKDGRLADIFVPISVERLAAVNELFVVLPHRPPVRFALGSLDKPFAALDKCNNDLIASWGVDPVKEATLSRPLTPIGQPQNWLTPDDYPASALSRGAQGNVVFRLIVDEHGVPSRCHIQQSSRPPEFDAAVCNAMMRRARYLPALDKDGKPVSSYYRFTVTFMIP